MVGPPNVVDALGEVFYAALELLARMGPVVGEGARMDFRVLGPVEVRDDQDRVVSLRGQLDRALLALLLLQANRQVRTDFLLDALWNGDPPKGGVGDYVRNLRRVLRETFADAVTLPRSRGACMISTTVPFSPWVLLWSH